MSTSDSTLVEFEATTNRNRTKVSNRTDSDWFQPVRNWLRLPLNLGNIVFLSPWLNYSARAYASPDITGSDLVFNQREDRVTGILTQYPPALKIMFVRITWDQ